MDYRNDLEAARLRINTLEAKLEETKASLNARDAELAECRVERDKLRQRSDGKEPSRWKLVAIGAGVLLLGLGIGYASGVKSSPSYGSAWGTVPKGLWSPPEDPGDHTKIEGKIQPPPEPPAPPPPATVSGETNTPAAEVTIDSIIQDSRPKVQACYRAEVKTHPKVSGNVKVVFDIDLSGKVSRTRLETLPYIDPWWSKTFESCVVEVFRPLVFPNETGTRVTASGQFFLSAIDVMDLGF